ncbi:amine oxidase B [Thecamonas trahens ATCC 50062]|uniref:monoamine oxidase n=1 Tax=Thecamonas trahens ATCC 50062 TaxID=461836 RepID=A0A0L0DTT8_THETB|nr:amine oxidase B [Thecamonas trahens ATCC 50062]KNC55749.1 amine oxidase B [Thecamonas trahens ATCC 50062]|eukprot:XP_013752902.1 amine oxidase B [Thecamonas trahens ATCC 50062]
MPPTAKTTDVVVVGAGFSGLAAARALRSAGLDVVVIDARTRVGGRARTANLFRACNTVHADDGARTDAGNGNHDGSHFVKDRRAGSPSATVSIDASNSQTVAWSEVIVLPATDDPDAEAVIEAEALLLGAKFDSGAAYIGPRHVHARLWELVDEFGLETWAVPVDGLNVLVRSAADGGILTYSGTIPGLSWLALLDLNHALRWLTENCVKVPLDMPHRAPRAAEWDAVTVQAWMDRTMWSASAKALLASAVRAVLFVEPAQISLLFWLAYCHHGQGPIMLAETRGGAQESKITAGMTAVATSIAEAIGPHAFHLGDPVLSIAQDDDGGSVVCASGTVVNARAVVVAMGPSLAGRLSYDPPLPPRKTLITQSMPMGAIIKCVMWYPTPFWRLRGFSGMVVNSDVSAGPISVAFDDSLPGTDAAALVGFISASAAIEWGQMSRKQRAQAVAAQYAFIFGREAGTPSPIAYAEHDWLEARWSWGGPTGAAPPGVLTTASGELATRHGCVHFAGTETACEWQGYVEGALEAGYRVASEVAATLGGRVDARYIRSPSGWRGRRVPTLPLPDRWLPSRR